MTTAIAVGAAIALAAPAVADPSPGYEAEAVTQPPEHSRAREKGKEKEKQKGKEKEHHRERHDRDRDERWDDDRDRDWHRDWDRDRDRHGSPFHEGGGEVPAFCRTGEGHPVFGMSWCHGNREGPAFCRTGEGHPEFGMRWCYEKGYGPGADHWRQYEPGDIDFDRLPRRPGDRDRVERPIEGRILDDALGDVIYGRLEARRDALGLGDTLVGYWHDARDGSGAQLLEIRAGDLPFAELVDLDGDGRVDMALVLEP